MLTLTDDGKRQRNQARAEPMKFKKEMTSYVTSSQKTGEGQN